jgi:hypothetical protein
MSERRFSMWEAVRREWLVVVVAALAGVAIAFAVANRAASTLYVASTDVTVLGLAGGPANPPVANDLVNAATLASVKRSAEESSGVPASALSGRISVDLESGDKRVVVFKSTAASEDDAIASAEAMADATVTYVLDRFLLYTEVQEETIEAMEQRMMEMRERAERLERQADSASSEQRAGYEAAAIFARNEAFDAEDEARRARQAIEQLEASMVTGETSVSQISVGGLQLSVLLQGLLLGIVVGVGIAALREWLIDRRAAA